MLREYEEMPHVSSIALVGLLVVFPTLSGAQETSEEDKKSPPVVTPETAEADTPRESPQSEADSQTSNPCDIHPPESARFLDKTRDVIFKAVCNSGRWFDDFWGDESYWTSARQTYGRFGLRLLGNQLDGEDVDVTFSANLPLPNLENKVNLFLRREDERQFVNDPDRSVRLVPALFEFRQERQWLLGAGYQARGSGSKGLSLDAGVELRTPVEPYVRGTYRHYWLVRDRLLTRVKPRIYWRNQHGFGTSLAADVDRQLTEDFLLRFSNFAGIDESTHGVDWRSGLTLFQMVGPDRAFAYQVAVEGETDDIIPVHRWVGEVTVRQRMFREWFFGEVLGGVEFVHKEPGSPREPSFFAGIGFELQFAWED